MYNYLTEPEAWQEIARRIAEWEWNQDGLCAEIADLYDEDRISWRIQCDMEVRLKQHLRAHGDYWAYERGTESEARILAALWLALEAEEDAA